MKLYVLIHHVWDTKEIRGVFSSEDIAKQNFRHSERHDCYIEEFELNAGLSNKITQRDTRRVECNR